MVWPEADAIGLQDFRPWDAGELRDEIKVHPRRPVDGLDAWSSEFERLDADGDGYVSRGEFLFDRLDADGDGAISRAELQAALAPRQAWDDDDSAAQFDPKDSWSLEGSWGSHTRPVDVATKPSRRQERPTGRDEPDAKQRAAPRRSAPQQLGKRRVAVADGGGKGGPVRALLREACDALGASWEQADYWEAVLLSERLEDLPRLRALPPAGWQRLGLPVGLEAELRRLLASRHSERSRTVPGSRRSGGPGSALPGGGGGSLSRVRNAPVEALRAEMNDNFGESWPPMLLRALRRSRGSPSVVDLGALTRALQAVGLPQPQHAQLRETLRLAASSGAGPPDAEAVVATLHGPLSGARRAAVLVAYRALRALGGGRVTGGLMRQRLAVLAHPEVGGSRHSAKEVSERLLAFLPSGEEVAPEQFLERHILLSALWLGGESEFENLVCALWQVPSQEAQQKSVSTAWEDQEDPRPPSGVPSAPSAARRHPSAPSRPARRAPSTEARAADAEAMHRRRVEGRLMQSQRAAMLVERLRLSFQREGPGALRALSRTLRAAGSRGPLRVRDLQAGLLEAKVDASEADVVEVLRAIDEDGTGSIDVEDWLRAIRGPLKPQRASAVREVYAVLAAESGGPPRAADLQARWRPGVLPDVEAGRAQPQEAWRELLREMRRGGRSDGFSERDLERYFEHVSATVLRDDHFACVARAAFGLPAGPNAQFARNRYHAHEGHLQQADGWLRGGPNRDSLSLMAQRGPRTWGVG